MKSLHQEDTSPHSHDARWWISEQHVTMVSHLMLQVTTIQSKVKLSHINNVYIYK